MVSSLRSSAEEGVSTTVGSLGFSLVTTLISPSSALKQAVGLEELDVPFWEHSIRPFLRLPRPPPELRPPFSRLDLPTPAPQWRPGAPPPTRDPNEPSPPLLPPPPPWRWLRLLPPPWLRPPAPFLPPELPLPPLEPAPDPYAGFC